MRTVRKPTLTGVKRFPLTTAGGNTPGTGDGKSVAVPVGVNNSAPIWVTVGVKVRGVLVDVAKRFCVGAGVMLAVGVGGLFAGGMGVGEAISFVRSDKDAQLERKIEKTRMINFFFIENPLYTSALGMEKTRYGFRTLQCVSDTSVKEATERPNTFCVIVDATS